MSNLTDKHFIENWLNEDSSIRHVDKALSLIAADKEKDKGRDVHRTFKARDGSLDWAHNVVGKSTATIGGVVIERPPINSVPELLDRINPSSKPSEDHFRSSGPAAPKYTQNYVPKAEKSGLMGWISNKLGKRSVSSSEKAKRLGNWKNDIPVMNFGVDYDVKSTPAFSRSTTAYPHMEKELEFVPSSKERNENGAIVSTPASGGENLIPITKKSSVKSEIIQGNPKYKEEEGKKKLKTPADEVDSDFGDAVSNFLFGLS